MPSILFRRAYRGPRRRRHGLTRIADSVGIKSAHLKRALPSGRMRRPDSLRLPDWRKPRDHAGITRQRLDAPEAGGITQFGNDAGGGLRSDAIDSSE